MRAEITARIRTAMIDAGLDAFIAVSPENFAYLTGFVVPSQADLRWRHAVAVLTADGKEAILCVDMEETTVRERAGETNIRVWGEFTDNSMAVLADLVVELGLEEGRIGTEFDYLPAGDLRDLERRISAASVMPAEAMMHRLRQVKTREEVDLLRRLSRISDTAIGNAFDAVAPGDTEMDLAAALTRSVYELGAEKFKMMIIATGERSQLPNVGPSDRVLTPGDVCRVEIFSMIGGYHAGVCRTAVVDHPPPEAERIWANLAECRRMLLNLIEPGSKTRPIYQAFLDMFGALGLPPIDFVGHGIGLHLHEDPYLSVYDESTLEGGMVLGVEPLVYRTGFGFGLQFKDMVAVTTTGSELLSNATDNEQLVVIK